LVDGGIEMIIVFLFDLLSEENLYITAKMTQKWLVPKCPL